MGNLLPGGLDAAVKVVGPAYIDEVVEVEGALFGPGRSARADYSLTEARRETLVEPDVFVRVSSPGGDCITVRQPDADSGRLVVTEDRRLIGPQDENLPAMSSRVLLRGVRRQLGGMGAGYALALGAGLALPVGQSEEDAARLLSLLDDSGIRHTSVAVPGARTDTTLVLSSSAGDKLPVGRRSASRRVTAEALLRAVGQADILVVTSLPNAVAGEVMRRSGGWVMWTPSLRNIREGGCAEAARCADALSTNSVEWQAMRGREEVRRRCPLVIVTHGAHGVAVSYRAETGVTKWIGMPAAPLRGEISDPNHAGEAFTASMVGALLAAAGRGALERGLYDEEAIIEAAWQGCLSARLELDIRELAFPWRPEVMALRCKTGRPRPKEVSDGHVG